MKLFTGTIVMLLLASGYSQAQDFKENQEPLSKNSLKGYLYDITRGDDGTSYITYKIRANKKSEDVLFEEYSFDKDLKFLGNKDVKEKKESYEDKEVTGFTAFVGGTTSFDVLSMKLKIQKVVALKKWNHEKQLFVTKKIISRENIKPRNDNGKVYLGYAAYESSSDDNSDLFVLAKAESKDKGQADNFFCVSF